MFDRHRFKQSLSELPVRHRCGRVTAADGASIEVAGLGADARIGDQVKLAEYCHAEGPGGEIVALANEVCRVMIFDPVDGLALKDPVWHVPEPKLRPCAEWIGRILDAFGRPLDGVPLPQGRASMASRRLPPPAASRGKLGARLATGLCVTDTMLPIAEGQRIGIFAGSGVGKSQLLSRLAKGVEAEVIVFALIGERGRELTEFLDRGLDPTTRARAVVVSATSDQSPLMRRRAMWTAMTVAEYFRDTGKHVLLLIDSLTRFAEAHREIALTAGETPSLRAFPPSTTNLIASLAERAGPGAVHDGAGAITALFSVLVAGSDMEEPVADITRGILDGHIILDRAIAERGRFPAIDVSRSVSRSLPEVATKQENQIIARVRSLLGTYEASKPMIQTGLYQSGTDAEIDEAIRVFATLDGFFASDAPNGPLDSFQRLADVILPQVGDAVSND